MGAAKTFNQLEACVIATAAEHTARVFSLHELQKDMALLLPQSLQGEVKSTALSLTSTGVLRMNEQWQLMAGRKPQSGEIKGQAAHALVQHLHAPEAKGIRLEKLVSAVSSSQPAYRQARVMMVIGSLLGEGHLCVDEKFSRITAVDRAYAV